MSEIIEDEQWKPVSYNSRWLVSNYGRVARSESAGLILLSIKMNKDFDEYCVYDSIAKEFVPVYDLYSEAFGMPDDPDWTPSLSREPASLLTQANVNWHISKAYRKQIYKNNPGFSHIKGFTGS